MDKTVQPKKRRIKDPESFRQIAQKTISEKTTKRSNKSNNKILSKFKNKVSNAFRASFNRLNKLPVFKQLFKLIRLLGLILIPRYIRNSFQELRGVTWPSFKESMRLTYAVIIFAVVFGVSIALVDYGLGKVFKTLLLK